MQARLAKTSGAEPDESLLIGTSRGVVRYRPGTAVPLLKPTRILSQRLHEPEELRVGLNLEYPQNSLALDVTAASSRTFPEQFQYAFLLYNRAGQEIKRKLSRDSQFLMESLPPGQYHVVAYAFTKDLIKSKPLTFDFRVAKAPFPLATTALSVILALTLVALWWGARQNRRIARTGAELKQANQQLAAARLDLANEAESERRRIARDLHDQTLADLRNLLMLTDQIPADGNESKEHGQFNPVSFRAEIEAVSKEIRRICEDLSPSVLENVGLIAALEWALADAVKHLPPERKFEYEFTADGEIEDQLQLAGGLRIQIYRIAQEVISNVCRHAAPTRVRLTVSLSTVGELILTIEDNGREFDPQDKGARTSRGLMNIRARASLVEAEVRWSKSPDGGTLFTLRKTNAQFVSLKEINTLRHEL